MKKIHKCRRRGLRVLSEDFGGVNDWIMGRRGRIWRYKYIGWVGDEESRIPVGISLRDSFYIIPLQIVPLPYVSLVLSRVLLHLRFVPAFSSLFLCIASPSTRESGTRWFTTVRRARRWSYIKYFLLQSFSPSLLNPNGCASISHTLAYRI